MSAGWGRVRWSSPGKADARMLVAVPLAASLGVVTRFAVEQYQLSLLYKGTGPDGAPPPDED